MIFKKFNQKLTVFIVCTMLILSTIPHAFAVGDDSIIIYHTNDIHGKIDSQYDSNGELTQIGMDVLKNVKSQTKNSLLVDAGDATQGVILAKYSKGSDIIKMMNAANYDLMALGNHDLDYGSEMAKTNANLAEFPVICANVIDESTRKPFLSDINGCNGSNFIKEINGKKIGFFAVISEDTVDTSLKSDIEGLAFTSIIETSKFQIKELKDQGAQAIIALTHVGINSSAGVTSEDLAENVSGIDVIIDGHSHSKISKEINGTLIQQVGTDAKNLGRLELHINNDNSVTVDGKILSADEVGREFTADAEVTQLYNDIYNAQKPILERVLSKTEHPLYGGAYSGKSVCRMSETNFGDLITDLMLESGKNLISNNLGNDTEVVALQNGGGIRDTIDAGYITVNDVNRVLPTDNTIKVKEITANKLYKALENGVSKLSPPSSEDSSLSSSSGKFPQVAGMRFEYDLNKPAYDSNNADTTGERITKIVILNKDGTDKKELKRDDETTKIKLVTNSFLSEGGEGFDMIKDCETIATGDVLETVVENGIAKIAKETGKPINYPLTQNRITPVNSNASHENYNSEITINYEKQPLKSKDIKLTIDSNESTVVSTDENGKIYLNDLSSGKHSITVEYENNKAESFVDDYIGLKAVDISIQNLSEKESDSVTNLISQLPDTISKDDKGFISFTRSCYDSLDENSKVNVTNYQSLTASEKALADIEKESNLQSSYNIIYVILGSVAIIALVVIVIKIKRKSSK